MAQKSWMARIDKKFSIESFMNALNLYRVPDNKYEIILSFSFSTQIRNIHKNCRESARKKKKIEKEKRH